MDIFCFISFYLYSMKRKKLLRQHNTIILDSHLFRDEFGEFEKVFKSNKIR